MNADIQADALLLERHVAFAPAGQRAVATGGVPAVAGTEPVDKVRLFRSAPRRGAGNAARITPDSLSIPGRIPPPRWGGVVFTRQIPRVSSRCRGTSPVATFPGPFGADAVRNGRFVGFLSIAVLSSRRFQGHSYPSMPPRKDIIANAAFCVHLRSSAVEFVFSVATLTRRCCVSYVRRSLLTFPYRLFPWRGAA
jgi:hypothetical protein